VKVIYIAGPFRSKAAGGRYNYYEQHLNIVRAEALAWKVWEAGAAPIAPHLNTIHFQGSLPDDVWLEGDIAIMKKCDAVLMTDDWTRSSGAREERRVAMEAGMTILYNLDEVKQFLNRGKPICFGEDLGD
jgi:hypothetical protein